MQVTGDAKTRALVLSLIDTHIDVQSDLQVH